MTDRFRAHLDASGLALLAILLVLFTRPLGAQISLPMTMENEWPVVPVVFGETNDTLYFIVDTGAALSVVSAGVADRLALPRRGSETAQGASGPQTVNVVMIPRLGLGTAEIVDLRAIVVDDEILTPYRGREAGYSPYDGVLGVEILSRFDVLLSEPTNELVLSEPGSGPGVLAAELAEPISFSRVHGRIIRHRVQVNGANVEAFFDSGARSMLLNGPAAELAGLEAEPGSEERTSIGVGTLEVTFRRTTIDLLEVGSTRFEVLPAKLADLPVFRALGFGARPAMLLGAPILEGCPVFISYRERTIRYCRRNQPGRTSNGGSNRRSLPHGF